MAEGYFLITFLSATTGILEDVVPGGGVMTLHDYGVPAARIFKELPCFGVKFSNIHPASESDFLSGIFSGGIYCYANFFCYANFSIVFKPIFFGGKGKFPGQIARGKRQQSAKQCIKTQK